MKVSKRLIIAGIAIVVVGMAASVILVAVAWHYLTISPFRRALPASATEIRDEALDGFPDYSYYLKAKMPREDFEPYCAAIGLSRATPERVSDGAPWLSWRTRPGVTWWTPSASLDATYERQEGHCWVLAKYENGEVYVTAFSH
jgi:hypothetical protein